ncbi:MAG: PorP/SprF family type IX secretion system membrane protein, partial [Bacteroidales bacterium]|nr:PorP/SprF family type IX secretion system membrane protein [Bacteroidales bacterium]
MKKTIHYILLFIFFIFLFINFIKAQDAYYTQFYNNPVYYNPSYVGLYKGLKARLNYRQQWPKLHDDLKAYNFTMDIAERELPGAGGLGFIANTNSAGSGLIKNITSGVIGSVRVPLKKYLVSQLGITAAFVQKTIDWGDYVFSDQLDNKHGLIYPVSSFSTPSSKKVTYPDFSLGGILNYAKTNINATLGAAIHHIFKPNESYLDLESPLPRKLIIHTDVIIQQRRNPKKGYKFNPGFMYENQAKISTYNLGMNVSKSSLYAGIWYRNKQSNFFDIQSVNFLVGFNFPLIDENSRLKVMYSYDLILIEPQGTGGSHEISLILGFDT